MVKLKFDIPDDLTKKLQRMETNNGEIIKKMLNSGIKVLYRRVKTNAPLRFRKHIKVKNAKKNHYGWFAQVQFRGDTRTGFPSSAAANIYENGRKRGDKKMAARPFIETASRAAQNECESLMRQIYETEIKKL